jgi:3',5'-cyclic AMP phosphodiesterase CpdA
LLQSLAGLAGSGSGGIASRRGSGRLRTGVGDAVEFALTATATDAEFEASMALVRPLTEAAPFLTIPGNHDVYTGESVGRFAEHFGAWSNGGRFPFLQAVGPVDVLALDVSRAGWLSNGLAPEEQLVEAERLLAGGERPVLVMIHYPLRGRTGAPYGPGTRNIVNAAAIEAVLVRHPRVRAILHGHEHHGFRTELPREGGAIPIYNPGATGYAYLPDRRRTAHFNVYEVDGTGIVGVDRYAWDGERFVPEAGGAYATGG